MLVLVILRRKKLALVKRSWLMVPILSFFIAYCLFLVATLLDYSGSWSDSWSVVIDILESELRRWMNYKYPITAVRPISVLSTLLATGPWLYFINRKWRAPL